MRSFVTIEVHLQQGRARQTMSTEVNSRMCSENVEYGEKVCSCFIAIGPGTAGLVAREGSAQMNRVRIAPISWRHRLCGLCKLYNAV